MLRISEMKRIWDAFKERMREGVAPRTRDSMDPDLLRRMARGILTTRPDEIGCDECFKQVDRFVDMILDGKDAAAAMPLVQDHLNRCRDCLEEYEALVTALRAAS
jgi:hypothetical protein